MPVLHVLLAQNILLVLIYIAHSPWRLALTYLHIHIALHFCMTLSSFCYSLLRYTHLHILRLPGKVRG